MEIVLKMRKAIINIQGEKIQKQIKVLGENTKELFYPRKTLSQINLSIQYLQPKQNKDPMSHHFPRLDEMIKNISQYSPFKCLRHVSNRSPLFRVFNSRVRNSFV
jgi:hypothetical protein